MEEERNCKYCIRNNGKEIVGGVNLINCGARGCRVTGDGKIAKKCEGYDTGEGAKNE